MRHEPLNLRRVFDPFFEYPYPYAYGYAYPYGYARPYYGTGFYWGGGRHERFERHEHEFRGRRVAFESRLNDQEIAMLDAEVPKVRSRDPKYQVAGIELFLRHRDDVHSPAAANTGTDAPPAQGGGVHEQETDPHD